MKNLVCSLFAIALVVSCGSPTEDQNTNSTSNTDTSKVIQEPEPAAVENSFALGSGVVGIFKIGEPVSALPEELNSRASSVTLTTNGITEEHATQVIFNSLEDVVELVLEKNDAKTEHDLHIQEMHVISNYYETSTGIKVGSTVNELLEKYPDCKFSYVGERAHIVAETDAFTGVQFIIDPAGCTKKVSGTKNISLSKSNFSEDAKIKAVRVY